MVGRPINGTRHQTGLLYISCIATWFLTSNKARSGLVGLTTPRERDNFDIFHFRFMTTALINSQL